jgi:hypothetical protein
MIATDTLEEVANLDDLEPGIDILNCRMGHTEVRFAKGEPEEVDRAKEMVQQMMRAGYTIFVHGPDGELLKVDDFDAERECYIIGKKDDTKKRKVPIRKARASAVGRTAGG